MSPDPFPPPQRQAEKSGLAMRDYCVMNSFIHHEKENFQVIMEVAKENYVTNIETVSWQCCRVEQVSCSW